MGVGVLGSEEGTKSVRYVKQILTRRLRSRLPKGLSELNYHYTFSVYLRTHGAGLCAGMGVGVLGIGEGTKSTWYAKQFLTPCQRTGLPVNGSELNYSYTPTRFERPRSKLLLNLSGRLPFCPHRPERFYRRLSPAPAIAVAARRKGCRSGCERAEAEARRPRTAYSRRQG